MTLTFDLVTLTLCHLQCCINVNPMHKFDYDPIICSWFIDLIVIFYIMAYVTLTFHLMTLTLCHFQHCININTMYNFHEDTIIRSWFIAQTIFSYNCVYDLDLWPCDLDLKLTWLSHWYQCYGQVPSRSKHPFGIYRRKHSMLTYIHTHTHTHTDGHGCL